MDRFRAMRVFVKVSEKGGFAAAGRDLRMSPPAVTRAVAALEDHLGTQLLVRTTRSLRLTESGERFLADARRILDELEEAEEAAIGSHAAPRGVLSVTAPSLFGRLHVAPILADFLDLYPQVNAEALFVDRVVHMIDEGVDVSVRIGELPDSSLKAARVGWIRRVVFGAPSYFEKYGEPEHPRELQRHRLIRALTVTGGTTWSFQENGTPVEVPVEPRLSLNSNETVIDLAAAGWGLSSVLCYQIQKEVAAGRLKEVLNDFETPPMPIHVLHQEGQRVSGKVRTFFDYLVDRLRRDPTLQ